MKTFQCPERQIILFGFFFSLSFLNLNSQSFSAGDFSTPREITTINNTTSGGNTRSMIDFADFNSNGKNDIVKVGVNQIIVLENIYTSGDITNGATSLFNNLTPMATASGSKNVVIEDINNDGKKDILVGCDSNASIFINTSTGGIISFNPRVDVSTYGPNVGLYDIDNDGLLDLVHSSNSYYSNLGINLNDNTAGIFSSTTTNFAIPYGSMEDWIFDDLDNDGITDFFSARAESNSSNTGIYVAKNNSTPGSINFGTLNFRTIAGMQYASYGDPKSISCTDLDNDGKADILVQLGNKTHFFLNTNSVGSLNINNFNESNITSQNSTSNFGLNFGIGDLDNDNKIDIISPGSNTSGTFAMKNNSSLGNISFGSSTNIQSITNQTTILVDLDGDTHPEIVNAQYFSDKIHVVKYQGAILGVKENNIKDFSVYPNPVKDYLNIETLTSTPFTINIYSILGRKFLTRNIKKGNLSKINVSYLSDGIYLLEINNSEKSQVIKFTKY